MRNRYIAAVLLSLILFLIYFQPFLAYARRAQPFPWWSFMVAVLVGGFCLSVGAARRHFTVATCMLITLLVAYFVMIMADEVRGTDHNLFPFELLFTTLLTLPAYVGTAIAIAVDQLRTKV